MRSLVPSVIHSEEQLPPLLEEYSRFYSYTGRSVYLEPEDMQTITSEVCATNAAKQLADTQYTYLQPTDIASRVWTGMSFYKPRPSLLIGSRATFPGTGLIIAQGLRGGTFPDKFEPEQQIAFVGLRKHRSSEIIAFGFETGSVDGVDIAAQGLHRYLTGKIQPEETDRLKAVALSFEASYHEFIKAKDQARKERDIDEGRALITPDYLSQFPRSAHGLLNRQMTLELQEHNANSKGDQQRASEVRDKIEEFREGAYHLGIRRTMNLDEFLRYYPAGEAYWQDEMEYIQESLDRVHSDHQATIDQVAKEGVISHPEFKEKHDLGRPSY